ncbi:MAG TPA: transposase [Abditibacteriaceae bacterium]|jgi:hypothetical protein
MNLDNLIIASFCQLDEAMKELLPQLPKARLRARAPQPKLCDSEVLTMEVVGAYLGFYQDKALFDYFRRHYLHFFLALASLHRTTFVRQAANLWKLKERLWQQLLKNALPQCHLSFLVSAPLPVCHGVRSTFCRRFRYADSTGLQATYGHDHATNQTFWGFRVHLHVSWPGFITRFVLAPGNVQELKVAPQLLAGKDGLVLGDRNYWSPPLQAQLSLAAPGLKLLVPYKKKALDPTPRQSRQITRWRYRLAQWAQRLSLKRVWARDVWHLSNRLLRAVLRHTICCRLNVQAGKPALQLATLCNGNLHITLAT